MREKGSLRLANSKHDKLIKRIFIQSPVRLTKLIHKVTSLQPLHVIHDPLNEALLETLENVGVLKRSKSPNGYVLESQINLPRKEDLTFEESLEMAQNALKEVELLGASGFSFSANIRFGDQQLLQLGESR